MLLFFRWPQLNINKIFKKDYTKIVCALQIILFSTNGRWRRWPTRVLTRRENVTGLEAAEFPRVCLGPLSANIANRGKNGQNGYDPSRDLRHLNAKNPIFNFEKFPEGNICTKVQKTDDPWTMTMINETNYFQLFLWIFLKEYMMWFSAFILGKSSRYSYTRPTP